MTTNEILVPVSPGELIDKMTILRIKAARIEDAKKVANVRFELAALEKTWAASAYSQLNIATETAALLEVNERLWAIEDDIRVKERAKQFDQQFIELARSVYFENDERAAIKRRINELLGSTLVEEKSYRDYR